MAINFYPKQGTILICEFSALNFVEPEMVKRRPVLTIAPSMKSRFELVTIVPLSTTIPNKIMPYHYFLTLNNPLPFPYDAPGMWVKGDMIYTFHFSRFNVPFRRDENGSKILDLREISEEELEKIKRCVLCGLGM